MVDFMVDLMGFDDGLMGVDADFMGFHGDFMGFHGGFDGIFVSVNSPWNFLGIGIFRAGSSRWECELYHSYSLTFPQCKAPQL